jgi:hypothetical protein
MAVCVILTRWLQAQLREMQKQVKGLTSELNMEQAAGLEHRDLVQRLQQELQDVKQLWLEAKRQVHLRTHAIYEDVHRCSACTCMLVCSRTCIQSLRICGIFAVVHGADGRCEKAQDGQPQQRS